METAAPSGKISKGKGGISENISVGANANIVCGHIIGRYAMVAAGAVVTRDFGAHELVAGIPTKKIGYVCECDSRLSEDLG